MTGHVDDIEGEARRAMVRRVIDSFATEALPKLAQVRSQVIHNDLNLHNVLVDPDDGVRVAGVIDFGDMVVGPLLFEPSIAAADIWIGKDDPLESVTTLVGAYHRVLPLREDEIGQQRRLVRHRFQNLAG